MSTKVDDRIRTVLAELERLALQRDNLETAWQAATTAIDVLLWCDEFLRAAALAERTIHDLGQEKTDLHYQRLPFNVALIAAEAYVDEPAVPRLRSAAAALPQDTVLAQQLSWEAERLQGESALETLLGQPWHDPQKPLGRRDRELIEKNWMALSGRELNRLWGAAQRANDFDLAKRIAHSTGTKPSRWLPAVWFAQWLVHSDQTEHASEVLLAAKDTYIPRAPWSPLPTNLPVDPNLRKALTTQVRQSFLAGVTNPFAEGHG